ncbi:MAG: FISUMP domain-containing protein, partial [Bacteroidota bacterium]
DAEWTTLTTFLGGESVAGGKMKSTSIQPTPGGWNAPNSAATNSSGFTGLPGGYRDSGGGFNNLGGYGSWWSSSVAGSGFAWSRGLGYYYAGATRYYFYHRFGFSVRCLKNTLPQVNTTSVASVTTSAALVTGEVISEGDQNTTRGFCYSTTSNPTVSNDTTMNGTGIGVYSGTLQNLTPSTTYYVRAYATNSVGTSYGSEVSFTTTSSITIGSNYAGGIVFYLDSTGQHGLVCAPSDQGNFQWGCLGTDIVGTSNAFGTGQANTNLILAGCSQRPIAASVCDDLVLNGYSDWYLPSRDELGLMYSNLHVQGIVGFSNTGYWSSSQYHDVSYGAWRLWFGDGNFTGNFKSEPAQVRAVRAF